MPNAGHFWTKDEDALCASVPFAEFNQAYPDISYHAYRFHRADMKRQNTPLPPVVRVVERGEGPETYSGLTTAFFDIETTYSSQPRVLGACIVDGWGREEEFRLDDPRYAGESWLDDSKLCKAYTDRLKDYDIVVTWNGKLFDVPVLNGRLAFHGLETWEPKLHIDAMYLASGASMRIGRRSLESVSKFFGTASKKTPLDVGIWDRADHGSKPDYDLIIEHCTADCHVLRETFVAMKRQVKRIHR